MAKASQVHPLDRATTTKDTRLSKEDTKEKVHPHGKGTTKERAKEHVTDVDRWDTWQRTAEYKYTT